MGRKKRDSKKAPVLQGAPEWMVTFGDLMSLLLTFFVLLFSISEIKEKKIFEMIKSFANYFEIDAAQAGMHLENFDTVQNFLSHVTRELPDRSHGHEGFSKHEVDNPLGKDVALTVVDDNLLLQIDGRVMFDPGSAVVKEKGREVLAEIRAKLHGFPNLIRVIGHTSPLPLPKTSEFEDHHDLGYRRAKAVTAILTVPEEVVEVSIDPKRIEVCSRGDKDAMPGVNPLDPAQRARLDRVDIIVTPYRVRGK
ncbi:MAG: flagellar motor protein MotB [Planctomycetota bacterium]